MAGLRIDDAVVTYPGETGRTTAVAGVGLHVGVGEVVALLGPSGCGKSSLLRAVAGLEPLDAGRITWDGADLDGVPVHRRGFGLMFQDGQLFGHRDVAGNVAFGLQMARVGAPARRERVAELLDLVGLAGYERRGVATLSGGEQQRVALARALAPRPRLLLLDEPLSALDRALRERLAVDLHDILRRSGTTALYVTHDHDEAFTVADRVAVMRAGRLVQVGTPAELWSAPADAETARFLGFRVVEHHGQTLALAPHALVITPVPPTSTPPTPPTPRENEGSPRERVSGDAFSRATPVLGAGEVAEEVGALTGTVRTVGFSRGRTTAVVDVPGWGEVRAVADGVAALAAGQRVGLSLDPRGVVVLQTT